MSVDPQARPTGALVTDALTHLSNLVRGEVALAKAEVGQNIRNAGTGIGLIAGAAILGITALNVLAAAAVAGLTGAGVPPWLSAVIVAVVCAVIAFLLWKKGSSALKLGSIAPTRTVTNVRRDAESIKETLER